MRTGPVPGRARSACVRAIGSVAALAALTVSAKAATLFGLVDTGELFTSADAGVTWSAHSTLPVHDAVALLRSSAGSDLHLVSRSGSVYISGDGGASWTAVGAVAASDVVAVDFAVGAPLPLVALTASGTLWGSADGGVSFSAVGALAASDHVSLARAAAGRLFSLTKTGTVGESVDGGMSWNATGTLPVSDAVEITEFGADLLVLTAAGDVWSSSDDGVSWTAIGTLSQVHMSSMIVEEGGALVAATREGEVAISMNGTSWTWVGTINQLSVVALATDSPPTSVEVDFPAAGAVFLSSPRPNPRRGPGGSWFQVLLPGPETVQLSLFDVGGRRIASRSPERFDRGGTHSVRWDPGPIPSGLYFLKMTTGSGPSAGTRWTFVR